MIQKLKAFVLSISSLIMFAVPLAVAVPAYAVVTQTDINDSLCSGSNFGLGGAAKDNCDTQAVDAGNKLLNTVVNVLSIIVGVVAVIMLIFGGFRYITSGGKQESVQGAKNTILYAIIGLVIVALAQVIVHFVLAKTSAATGP